MHIFAEWEVFHLPILHHNIVMHSPWEVRINSKAQIQHMVAAPVDATLSSFLLGFPQRKSPFR